MIETPIGQIPPMQILAGELRKLRRQARRLHAEASIKDNERQQDAIKAQLRKAGREDLIQIA